MKKLKCLPKECASMSKIPKDIWYLGDKKLLEETKVSIVGTRRPLAYTKDYTFKLARALAKRGVVIVSGAAMGVDAIAHQGAGTGSTIAVMANGLDIRYPSVNKNLITDIEKRGLTLSFYEPGFKARNWSFVARNELVVALGEVLVVTEAELKSGSMRSVEYALEMGKEIYVLTHRLNESSGTNWLLQENKAKPIYNIDAFANCFALYEEKRDNFLKFIEQSPTLEAALEKFGDRVYEAELEGTISILNGIVQAL